MESVGITVGCRAWGSGEFQQAAPHPIAGPRKFISYPVDGINTGI